MRHAKIQYPCFFLIPMVLLICLPPAYGQIRSGAAFLKMLPGARVQAMAAGHTGFIDDPLALYANPGATGFIRKWQWSAGYNKWIADVYSASLLFGGHFRTPISRKTHAAFGILYYGVPSFDSSDRAAANASASDFIASLSLGQPLTPLSENISLGVNLKYLKSTLERYCASSWVFDVGLLSRTQRFSLPTVLFEHGILSAGISLTNMGKALNFEKAGTPLPKNLRFGLVFYAGTHNGLQFQLAGDYHTIKDENDAFSLGTEMSWRRWFSVRAGYDFNSDLMNQISFGAGIRLDDINTAKQKFIPGRNNALRIDLATLDEGEFFSRTYRGTIAHHPISPENFDFIQPAMDDTIDGSRVVLKWEKSRDPDLYDDVHYTLLLERDSTKLANVISIYDKSDIDKFIAAFADISIRQIELLEADSLLVDSLSAGHYYWTVFAADRDQHVCFAEKDNKSISHFYVPYPDIEIQNIEFKYSPWITQDDYHGDFEIKFSNKGDFAARNFLITLYDSANVSNRTISGQAEKTPDLNRKLAETRIEILEPGAVKTITLGWHTSQPGSHRIHAVADAAQAVTESNELNNELSRSFYTIPKGTFACKDTVNTILVSQVSLDMPIITEICFDTNSTIVKPEYLHKTKFDPPIATLAGRLVENPHLSLTLRGFADTNSGENNVKLANDRSVAVRDALIQLGVNADQVEIKPGKVLPKRKIPAKTEDARWVFEERRYVKISTSQAGEEILFLPVCHIDNEELPQAVNFHSQIKCAVPVKRGQAACFHNLSRDTISIKDAGYPSDICKDIEWNPAANPNFSPDCNTYANYALSLTDTLGRTFRTRAQRTYLNKSTFLREHRIAFPLKFAQTDPLYSFYWSRIFSQVKKMLADPQKRMSFNGHACGIGPKAINERLSKRRARKFHKGFLNYIKKEHQEYLNQILGRLNPAQGFGENNPLGITRLNGEHILIGDNNTPPGRKLNRRIEVVFSAPIP